MMKKIIIIIVMLVVFLGCENRRPLNEKTSDLFDSIELVILDNRLNQEKEGFVRYEIQNHSNQRLYIPLINEYVEKMSDLNDEMNNDNFYIYVYNKNGKFIRANVGLSSWGPTFDEKDTISSHLEKMDSVIYESQIKPYKLIITGLLENVKYTFYKRDSKILKGKSKIEGTAIIYLKLSPYNRSFAGDIYAYDKRDSLQNAKIQLVLHIDSTQMKERLLPKDIDSLRENGIKIFHGTLYSNKLPLKIEE